MCFDFGFVQKFVCVLRKCVFEGFGFDCGRVCLKSPVAISFYLRG